jgi:hypothetical protein
MPFAADPGRLSFFAEPGGDQAMEVTGCPEAGCSLPAEILDRAMLRSTDGPIEHARIACLGGHRCLMPIEMLTRHDDLCGAGTSAFAVHAGERWSQ